MSSPLQQNNPLHSSDSRKQEQNTKENSMKNPFPLTPNASNQTKQNWGGEGRGGPLAQNPAPQQAQVSHHSSAQYPTSKTKQGMLQGCMPSAEPGPESIRFSNPTKCDALLLLPVTLQLVNVLRCTGFLLSRSCNPERDQIWGGNLDSSPLHAPLLLPQTPSPGYESTKKCPPQKKYI